MSDTGTTQEGFTLGRPALVCRWRLAGAELPMASRHLRALGQRRVNGEAVSPNLVAWAQQHVEWTLHDGAMAHPDGVLMLIVDDSGKAAMTVGSYEPLANTTAEALAGRAFQSAREGEETGVAPETLWAVHGDSLEWGVAPGASASGTSSLVRDLAQTVGLAVSRNDDLIVEVRERGASCSYDEVFLASDEHGVVTAADLRGPRGERFAQGYERLLQSVRSKAAKRPHLR